MVLKMTDEQRQFAEDNMNLVYSYAYKHKIDIEKYEDLMGELFLEYCRVVKNFDKTKGAFSTYLYQVLDNKRITLYNYNKCKCRYADEPPLSLNMPQYICDESGVPEDLCIEYNDDSFDIIDIKDACKSIAQRLDEAGNRYSHNKHISTADIFKLLSKGYTRRAIGEKYGISQQAISKRVINVIRPIWETEMGECICK